MTQNANHYVTHRWLFATAFSGLAIAAAAMTLVVGVHADRPHKGTITRSEMASRDRLNDERHKQIIKRLDMIESMLRNR